MSNKLQGTWVNSYHSKLKIAVDENGSVAGEYSSTTGSSGIYQVIGHTITTPQAERNSQQKDPIGQGVVLSIYWRAVDTGATPDNTWHWVSTYCGQLQPNGDLSVINSLVATAKFDGFIEGDYIDQLIFKKTDDEAANVTPINFDQEPSQPSIPSNLDGLWQDALQATNLCISVLDEKTGLTFASVKIGEQSLNMWGFSDTRLMTQEGDSVTQQSITLSGYLNDPALAKDHLESKITPISISGYLDLSNQTLFVSKWLGDSTDQSTVYYQSNLTGLRLTKI
ncbi:avidin/streptavidin family protein [Marinomonas mediterranea]|jgi:Avidin family.|uniref:Avidin family protein n=1 Tax=Marinomonas mediterranea (strain ATCC 700492 / JCM 21426 / NBRC 103028 / MMB-1) TaxID=717774 RepID=F2JWY8_MARM1|nr:avidin/streptavidin family protein [Marinomonas mediterranea]ADZ93005.1 hypothetical protein Marme_3795 [Marinomonas mediterranea MMB-1]WCN10917.1 hypothetical protein GV055_19280 [Marinomonas mediterranea]WCN14979.1 hypothetical protein GV054_19185 [Marinomonas mediterranea]WCN19023.1 hypothetical protein GV053_19240 [Marinomonas mediterranea MMB-1]